MKNKMLDKDKMYKNLKQWVVPKNSATVTPYFKYLVFGGSDYLVDGNLVATDGCKLILIKNQKCNPHLETWDGTIVDSPKVKKEEIIRTYNSMIGVIPSNADCQWSTVISNRWFTHIKNACEFICISSKKDINAGMSMLNYENGRLWLLSSSYDNGSQKFQILQCGHKKDTLKPYAVKFLLADKIDSKDNWYGFWNAEYLRDAMEMVIGSKAESMRLSVKFSSFGKGVESGTWKIETDDMIMVAISMRCRVPSSESKLFNEFMNSESVIPESGIWKRGE